MDINIKQYMTKKNIIIILCVLLAVCITAGAATAIIHSDKDKPAEESTVSSTLAEESSSDLREEESQTQEEAAPAEQESLSELEDVSADFDKPASGNEVPEGATTAKDGSKTTTKKATTKPAAKEFKISFSITCHNAVDYGAEGVPSSGYILKSTTYTATEGETVYDALKKLCNDNGIDFDGSAYYIKSIGGLKEKACGSGSGWMYRVNGEAPPYPASSYFLSDGDVVEWYYVTKTTDR